MNMPKTPGFFFLLTLAVLTVKAQEPPALLDKWANEVPIEKLYLHYDRSGYFPGQTIWFKAYVYAGYLPSSQSTSLYVELIDAGNKVINRQVYPIFGGFARGQVDIPDTVQQTSLAIRAYTLAMLNHDPSFIYRKIIPVFNKNGQGNSFPKLPAATRMEFFPEGGNFVAGLSNTLAFKITDGAGFPLSGSGKIISEDGSLVSTFTTLHDGMGYVDIAPATGSGYHAILDNDPGMVRHPLPLPSDKGVVLRLLSADKARQFEILQHTDDPDYMAAYIVGQMQHRIVFRSNLGEATRGEITGTVKTGELPSGIMQVTVFNREGLPLAERLTFINNQEYIQEGTLEVDTLGLSQRAYNRMTLSLPGTVVGSFSVSVYDADFDDHAARTENIFSGLLLTSDLRGYVHNPAYYFSSENDTVREALDLLMMTNGWRRFEWNKLSEISNRKKGHADPGFIRLSGKVLLEGTKKPFADRQLMAFIVTADSSRQLEVVTTDAEGRFNMDSIVYFGRARILFSDTRGRKSRFIDVELDGDSLTRQFELPPLAWDDLPNDQARRLLDAKKMKDEYEAILKADGTMLGEVVIKGKKKSKMEEFEEKYVSGLFSGEALRKLDFLEEDLGPYANIFEFLRMRVPGLTVIEPNTIDSDGPAEYTIMFRQSASISGLGSIPMTIFLDEVQISADVVASIPANQIALVKLYSSFVGAPGSGAGGALAIYTKRGADLLKSLPNSGDMIVTAGYSVTREFYSPDYSVKQPFRPDQRITLYWNSGLIAAGVNSKLPIRFYNNDRTKRFRVIIEGMTAEGKMLLVDRVIEGRKAF